MKSKIIRWLKILSILALLAGIGLVSFLHWKGDLIIEKVLDTVQGQLTDSLSYSSVHLAAFRHFPRISVSLDELSIGSGEHKLLQARQADILLSLGSLFHSKLDIQALVLDEAVLQLNRQNGKWNYNILKKKNDTEKGGWQTAVHQLSLTNSRILYREEHDIFINIAVPDLAVTGWLAPDSVNAKVAFQGALDDLKTKSYSSPDTLDFTLEGHYILDPDQHDHSWRDVRLNCAGGEFSSTGFWPSKEKTDQADLRINWKKTNPAGWINWLPEKWKSAFADIELSGEAEGELVLKSDSPSSGEFHTTARGVLKKGKFTHRKSGAAISPFTFDYAYDSRNPTFRNLSTFEGMLERKSLTGPSFKAEVSLKNLNAPVLDAKLDGDFPATLFNLFTGSSLDFETGEISLDHLQITGLAIDHAADQWTGKTGKLLVQLTNIKAKYQGTPVVLGSGQLQTDGDKKMHIDFEDFHWDKAVAALLKGDLTVKTGVTEFDGTASMCGGKVAATGHYVAVGNQTVLSADWIIDEVDISSLFEQFSDFDQTFITSKNLSGKATIKAETSIPFDQKGNVLANGIVAKAALEIRDGRLKDLKTLEDFSDYIHVEDLRDIRFHEMKNYIEIAGGRVFLPVMFLQSSAINMSINGLHGFDQKILYNIKLNAGQALSAKLKKTDLKRDLKPARKSGWINLYFVLDGDVQHVRYVQNRVSVISGFEQSAQRKEDLRNYLVDKFGYDVYWIEPNEWEDIPEYK